MPERIREIRPFELSFECEGALGDGGKCGGTMMATGDMMQGPRQPLHKHVCMKCRNVKFLPGVYPQAIGLPINVEIPEQWLDKLDRAAVHNPPEPKPKIVT